MYKYELTDKVETHLDVAIYDEEKLIGWVYSEQIAKKIVTAVNSLERLKNISKYGTANPKKKRKTA